MTEKAERRDQHNHKRHRTSLFTKCQEEMDPRLFEAAQTGNTTLLHQLLTQNPLMLNIHSLFTSQNPLHISSISGHADFTMEILRLKPEFAVELDPNGFSPLHMAAATGNVLIATELMMVDPKLCRLEGWARKTPFHCAAEKGKVDVIKEMILRCDECLEDVTVQGESALHLAVKNYRFEAVRTIVGLIREKKREDLLNFKDERGNTALHLATWTKQRQVIELFLGKEATSSEHLEVNASNQSGLTALDLLFIFPSAAGDREIEEMLRNSGAVRSRDIDNSTVAPVSSHSSNRNQERSESQGESLLEYFKFKRGRDSPNEARTALLVVATLVATTTFQAGFNPPQGLWQESHFPDASAANQKKYLAGWSILGTYSAGWYEFFLFFNSVGFNVALAMIDILNTRCPLQLELRVCLLAMYTSYNTAVGSVSPDDVKVFATVTTTILSALTPYFLMVIKEPVRKAFKVLKLWVLKVFECVMREFTVTR